MKPSGHRRTWDKKTLVKTHILSPEEVERLPEKSLTIRIRSGKAWVSISNKDVLLRTGEVVALKSRQGSAVISGLGQKPIEYDVDLDKPDSSN